MGGEGFVGGVVLEGDDVDGFAGGACDGCYSCGIEGFVAGDPFGEHVVVDGEGCFGRRFLDRAGRRYWFSVAGLIGRVVLLGPFLPHWWRGRLLERCWC